MFVFLHIPKTAGKTIVSVIEDQHTARWSEFKLDEWNPQIAARAVEEWQQAHPRALQIFHGHQHYGIHSYLSVPVTYYTLLRDPVERAVSHYYYVLHRYILSDRPEGYSSEHPDKRLVREGQLSLEEYVLSGYCPEMDNGQTRLLAGESGLYERVPFGLCTPDLLETAKRNLQTQMGVVGLTERFDASLLLLQRLCGWSVPFYVSHNVTPHRPRRADISAAALAAIHERTVLDRALYAYAVELFDAQAAAQGPEFDADVRRFQERNRREGAWRARGASALRRVRQAGRFAADRLGRERIRPAACGIV